MYTPESTLLLFHHSPIYYLGWTFPVRRRYHKAPLPPHLERPVHSLHLYRGSGPALSPSLRSSAFAVDFFFTRRAECFPRGRFDSSFPHNNVSLKRASNKGPFHMVAIQTTSSINRVHLSIILVGGNISTYNFDVCMNRMTTRQSGNSG